MIGALRSLFLVAVMTTAASAEPTRSILSFDDLDGWAADDHGAALSVFLNTCGDLNDPDWQALCRVAQTYDADAARSFFELFFRPVLVEDGEEALFTGYFEPELDGSKTRTDRFKYPIYKIPPEARAEGLWLSRREILTGDAMQGRGLEIAWVDDPVELFFLQIQGSGRVRLPDGSALRVGYGGANGHPYRSIGTELIRQGALGAHEVSAQMIRAWVRKNPEAGAELLFHNPSYVFFREVSRVAPELGPLGAMNRSVTTMRSIAADPAHSPLGAPVWVEKDGKTPLRRLMIAQDTGAAIKGAQRADIFFGTGDEAGKAAGRLRDPGRMVLLLPIQRAYALLPDEF
ncbi:murein transglycosylase A [Ruegeria atlantica]|uniref:peptidoglycan lytic exotransglycosylase n=1 Tax=Ruegeria atlantica TaxID=81569 RepID=A0A0N7LR63_9RHOB|nr:murein transglycosylase A [Ruegeria atlantica]CUH49940.1 Membrane-bound lytic murein transglycosylase A precursor [Ruegeria atlantica]